MKNKRKSTALRVVITMVVFTIVIVALAIWGQDILQQKSKDKRVSVPAIKTTMISSKDGLEYNVEAKMHIEVDPNTKVSLSSNELHDKIEELMTGLDYERLIEADGMDYLKDGIKECLSPYFNDSELKNIYITEIANGDLEIFVGDNNPGTQRQNEVLDKLKR